MTKKHNEIIRVEMPAAEAADMTIAAAALGVSLSYYVGFLALLGAYGPFHPRVVEMNRRTSQSVFVPKTQEEDA